MTERVHPQVAARAVEAAQVIGLDIAGVDVVATDISVPLEEQGGVIVEINAAPGLRMHLQPSVGISRPVGEAIVATLFPDGDDGRIPIAAVTGTNGKTTTTRFIAHILRGKGLRVGMTCTDGIYIDSRRIDTGDCAGPQSARAVLMNPSVEAAVFETARGGILREGLAFDSLRRGGGDQHRRGRPPRPERGPHRRDPGQGEALHRRRRAARRHFRLERQRSALRGHGPLFGRQDPLLRPGRQSSGDRAASQRRRAGDLRSRQHDHRGRRSAGRGIHVA